MRYHFLLASCGGGSSSSPLNDEQTNQDIDPPGQEGGESNNSSGEDSDDLTSIAGMWNASSDGDFDREEYWNITEQGQLTTHIYRDGKIIRTPSLPQGFQVGQCFEKQTSTISALGNNVFDINGIFDEERNNGTYEFSLNPDDTLQAVYASDLVICGNNGCGTSQLDVAYPRTVNGFSTDKLFLCPSEPASTEPLITSASGADENPFWNCSLVDQENREAKTLMATVTLGADGTGRIDGRREFSWNNLVWLGRV